MMEQNTHQLSDKVKTFITEGFDGWQVGFTVEQQTFYLQPVSSQKGDQDDTPEKAKWYQKNIEFALQKLITNSYQSSTGEQKQESAGVWVDAVNKPKKPGWYHTNVGLIQFDLVGEGIYGENDPKELMWLNRYGGHVTKWLDESAAITAGESMKDHAVRFNEWLVAEKFEVDDANGWYSKESPQAGKQTWFTISELYDLWPERNQSSQQ